MGCSDRIVANLLGVRWPSEPCAGGANILAFFELPSQPGIDRDRNTPAWVQHLALQCDSVDKLLATK
jgi:hypothetical protein